jgi:hypothetical protein
MTRLLEADLDLEDLKLMRACSLSPTLASRYGSEGMKEPFDDNPPTPDGSEQPPVPQFSRGLDFLGACATVDTRVPLSPPPRSWSTHPSPTPGVWLSLCRPCRSVGRSFPHTPGAGFCCNGGCPWALIDGGRGGCKEVEG